MQTHQAGPCTVVVTNAAGSVTSAVATLTVVQPPSLGVTPPSLDFGLISTGAMTQASFVASNAGTATLQGSATVGAPLAILSGTFITLNQSLSTNLVIRFAPSTPGVFSNVMVFTSNGGDSTNTVTGRAIGTISLLSSASVGANFSFSFDTLPGFTYVVEYKNDLNAPVWLTLQSVAGDGTLKTITNLSSTYSQCFYRLKAQ